MVFKSWKSKSVVRFLIRCIFDPAVLLSPNLQKRTYAQENFLFIRTHWFLSQIHGIRSVFAGFATQSYQNFQRGVWVTQNQLIYQVCLFTSSVDTKMLMLQLSYCIYSPVQNLTSCIACGTSVIFVDFDLHPFDAT